MNLTDYLMVFALLMLLVTLSFPTITQLAAILKGAESTPGRSLPVNSTNPPFEFVPSSSRLTAARVQAGSASSAVV
jgi:hypothetical protein